MASYSVFDLAPITGSGDVGTLLWVDLGLIPISKRFWFGPVTYYCQLKAASFELRTNAAGKSAGTDSDTTSIDLCSVRAGVVTPKDLYVKNRYHKVSIYGNGVERIWLKIKAKSTTLSYFDFSLENTLE